MQQTLFQAGPLGTFSADELRTRYLRSSQPSESQSRVALSSAEPEVPKHLLTGLTRQLRPLLDCYLDPESDRVGNGLAELVGKAREPTTPEFAQILIRAAATLGSKRVVGLLSGWIDGEPLHYRAEGLLLGAVVGQPLELANEGVRIEPLPKSPADLAASVGLPGNDSFYDIYYSDFMNGVVRLSIDCTAEPALYKPSENGKEQRNIQRKWAQGRIPEVEPYKFCEALSLACNRRILWALWWPDYGELCEFGKVNPSVKYPLNIPKGMRVVPTREEHLKEAVEIYLARHARKNTKLRRRLDIAISRWIKSKGLASLADKLIDLRIALEALYLEGDRGEMRFRLATHGAWHLGTDPAERRKYHKALRDTYDLASKAIHAGSVQNTPENQEKLRTAQDLCRQGILKRLTEDPNLDWKDLILGAETC